MKLPQHITRHQAAQDAGHFQSHYLHTTTAPMKHHTPIVTNARQGKPISANHRRRSAWPIIIGGCILFWSLVAAAFLA